MIYKPINFMIKNHFDPIIKKVFGRLFKKKR